MKVYQYFFAVLGLIGFVLVVWAPFNDLFRKKWKTLIPVYGLKFRTKESWIMMWLGLLFFLVGMIGLSLTWK